MNRSTFYMGIISCSEFRKTNTDHRIISRSPTLLIAVILVGFPGYFFHMNAGGEPGDVPPGQGDWIITDTVILVNETIQLDGNLIIEPGGNLTLINVTILFNCSYDGEYGIYVKDGGELYVSGVKEIGTEIEKPRKRPMRLYLGIYHGSISIYEYDIEAEEHSWNFISNVRDKYGDEIHVSGLCRPIMADLDGDNDLDLVIGETSGILIYYENQGSNNEPEWIPDETMFSGIDVGENSAPNFADLDDDGDLDLTIGSYSGLLYHYENTGTINNPQWELNQGFFPVLDGVFNCAPEFGDLDDDGDQDLIVGRYSGRFIFYKNSGSPHEAEWTEETTTFAGLQVDLWNKPILFDNDGDGDLDLSVGNGEGKLDYFENTGTSFLPVWDDDTPLYQGIDSQLPCAPILTMIEREKVPDLDMVVGGHFGTFSRWQNQGSPDVQNWVELETLSDIYGHEISAGIRACPIFADLDNDGDQDLTIGSAGWDLVYYENIGSSESALWEERTDVYDVIKNYHTIRPQLADLDYDGDLDLIIGCGHDSSYIVYYYENIGTASSCEWQLNEEMFESLEIFGETGLAPCLRDLDGDFDLDLTVGTNNGYLYYYENAGSRYQAEWTNKSSMYEGIDVGWTCMPAFSDFDEDGDFDLTLGEYEGNLNYYKNTGTKFEPEWTLDSDMFSAIDVEYYSSPTFTNLGDDKEQFSLGVELPHGNCNSASIQSNIVPLLVCGGAWGNFTVFENIGSIGDPEWIVQRYLEFPDGTEIKVPSRGKPAFADLDGDGDLDLTAGEIANKLWYFRNDGNQFNENWIQDDEMFAGIDTRGYGAPEFGDLDDDGDLDLLIGNYYGEVRYYENTGGPTQPQWTENPSFIPEVDTSYGAVPRVVDIDGDGDFDLVTGGFNGNLWYWENTGTPSVPEWENADHVFNDVEVDSYSRPEFNDMDGDGDYDLTIGSMDAELCFYENIGDSQYPVWEEDETMYEGTEVDFAVTPCFYNGPTMGEFKMGNYDLIVGNYEGNIKFYENTGTKMQYDWTLDDSMFGYDSFGHKATPAFGDLDNDGDIDLIIGRREPGTYNGTVLFMENIGTRQQAEWKERGLLLDSNDDVIQDENYYVFPNLADLDNDKDLDLILVSYYGDYHYYNNTGTPEEAIWTPEDEVFNGLGGDIYNIPNLVDLDSDDDYDLVFGSYTGEIRYHENIGTKYYPDWIFRYNLTDAQGSIIDHTNSAPDFIDLDNDGDLDLITGCYTGQLHYYKNTGTCFEAEWTYIGTMADSNGQEIVIEYSSIPVFVDLGGFTNGDEPELPSNWFTEITTINNYAFSFQCDVGSVIELVDMKISNCGYDSPGSEGMMVMTNNATIMGNLFSSNHWALVTAHCNTTNTRENYFQNNDVGIFILNCTILSIMKNQFRLNEIAIFFERSEDCMVKSCNISLGTYGIYLNNSHNNVIRENKISDITSGILVNDSGVNLFQLNNISDCTIGMHIINTSNQGLTLNDFNRCGLLLEGKTVEHYSSHILNSNQVNGKPLLFLKNISNNSISNHAGQVIAVNCMNISIEGKNISNNTVGVHLAFTHESSIFDSKISDNYIGIILHNSSNNNLLYNNIQYNDIGLNLRNRSEDNLIMHNNFLNNKREGMNATHNEGLIVKAHWNYWGNSSGPYHNYTNPGGGGDNVTNHISYSPWHRCSPGNNNWYVNANASSGGDGSVSLPYSSIQDAIDNASRDETIHVNSGLYKENIILDKPITIIGHDKPDGNHPVVDACGGAGLIVKAKSTITNFTIQNSTTDLILENDLDVYNTKYATIDLFPDNILRVGYYLDVLLLDRSGSPLTGAFLEIENNITSCGNFVSDNNGIIQSIPLFDHVRNSSGITDLNPYYLNASHSQGYTNRSLILESNKDCILVLSHHGKFGHNVVSGDINGDGWEDQIVGAPLDDRGGWNAGAVFIYFGSLGEVKKELIPEEADIIITGNSGNLQFGNAIAVDDINGDLINELVVTAPTNNESSGGIYLFPGFSLKNANLSINDGIILHNAVQNQVHFNDELITADVDLDGYTDILAGYQDGIMIFHGQPMIIYENFSALPLLSGFWDPNITGNGGEMRIEDHLVIDTDQVAGAYAYAMSNEMYAGGFEISISVERGNAAEFFAGIDYKVPVEDISNIDKQRNHALFKLYDHGLIEYTPICGGNIEAVHSGYSEDIIEFKIFISQEYDRLVICANDEKFVDTSLEGWTGVYLKLGDSTILYPYEVIVHEFSTRLLSTNYPGIRDPVSITYDGNEFLAVTINQFLKLIPLGSNGMYHEVFNIADDFNGIHNWTIYNNGLTLTDECYSTIFPNGDFESGWDNWSHVENEQGINDAGRWEIRNATYWNVAWDVCVGHTAGFGIDKDTLAGDQVPHNGRLRSENITIPESIDTLSLWYKWQIKHFDINDGLYPDEINIKLRNASDDFELLTIAQYIPSGTGYSTMKEAWPEINITSFRGMTVYLTMDIITDNSEFDEAIAQIDEIFGIEKSDGLYGDFISNMINLENEFTHFIPSWEVDPGNGDVRLFYRTQITEDWVSIKNGVIHQSEMSEFQYKVVFQRQVGEPTPILRNLDFSFYYASNELSLNGEVFCGGEIYDGSSLILLNDTEIIVYHGTDPYLTIQSDDTIYDLTTTGDIDGNGFRDLMVSSNNTVYLVLMDNITTLIYLENSPYFFPGAEGFGYSLSSDIVGSPFENENDGRAFVVPVYLNDCAVVSVDLENNSLLYPDSTLNLAINILNRGLLDAHDLCLTMNISDDNEYSYSDSITNISLTSWNSTSYRFSWQVPDVEGLRYTITFELPDDNDNNNNELTIQTRAHFHALNISTEKDYYSTGVNGLMRYTLKIENHGSFGSDNVSIEFNRPNDWGWWIELDGKIVNDIVIINSEIIELFVEANTTLDQYHMEFYVISENNWTKDSQKLIGFVVDRDLEIINISYYRNDGKEAQVVEGELSKISLTILNYGSQSAGIFGIWLFLDGYETSDVYIPSLTCNETKIVDFMISLPKGDHNLTFWLDKNDTVMEYNDLNNKRGQDISVRSENSSSSFNFNVIVVDITGKVKKDSTVCVYLDNEKYSNTTDIEGFTTVILPAPFKEGSIIRLEAWEEEIYSSAEVRVYSEDESIDISMTVSKYSMRVRCNDRLRPITPGENNIYLINITNMGDLPDTYNIDIAGIPNGWSYNLSGEGLEMGSFYLENDLSCDLRLNISSDKYTIFGSNIEINITIRSSIYWRFNEYCIIKPYLELIDNITLFSSTSILSGKPGDSLYHEIIISNEGNALRNVTMLQFGDVEYSALNKNIVRLQPGTSKSCWLSIKVPNLAAPTKLHQTVYGVFSPEGSTNSLIFTTVIQPFSEIKAEIIDNELHITNQGNIHEELILHIGLDTGVIIPDIDKVILGIGETRSVPLRIEMTDLSIEAGNPQVVSVTIFNGEEYSYFTKLITVPEVQDISFFVENYDNSVSPGEMIQICMVIQNNGNTVEKISFTCQNSGPEPLIIPVIMDLDPGEITDAIFQLYLPEDAYGPRVISISGISEWNTTTIDIELMVEEDFTIELHEMSVSQRSGKTRYKVNLYNKGSTDEFVTLESDYGIVDIELMVLESGSSRTVYLTLDESEIPQDGINLIVYSQRCKDMWTNISILPPPRTSITILGDFPGRVGTPLQLQAAGIGNFMWDIDGNILYGKTINYSFKRSGNHEIKLILTDSRGLTFRCNKTLLLENTKPQLNVPSHMYVQIGEYVRFDASEINDPDGMIADYIWIIENQKYYRPVVYHIFETSGEFNVTLIIIDDLDGMNTTNIQVFAQKIEKVVEVEEKNLDTEIIYTTSVFLIICITVILYVFISMDNKEDRIIKQLLSMKSESVPPSPSLQEYNDSVKSKDQINEIAPDNNRMCKECNANIPEHFSYCHKCGVNLDETIDSGLVNISNVEDERRQGSNEKGDDQMINNLNFCPSCGCTLPKFYNYCNKCGLALPKPLEKMNTDNRSNNET